MEIRGKRNSNFQEKERKVGDIKKISINFKAQKFLKNEKNG